LKLSRLGKQTSVVTSLLHRFSWLIMLGKNEPSLSSKAHGPLLTLIRWSVGFATKLCSFNA